MRDCHDVIQFINTVPMRSPSLSVSSAGRQEDDIFGLAIYPNSRVTGRIALDLRLVPGKLQTLWAWLPLERDIELPAWFRLALAGRSATAYES